MKKALALLLTVVVLLGMMPAASAIIEEREPWETDFTTPMISMAVDKTEVKAGETIAVTVSTSQTRTWLSDFQFDVFFDSDVLERTGGIVGTSYSETVVGYPRYDDPSGIAYVPITGLSVYSLSIGLEEGVIGTVVFTAKEDIENAKEIQFSLMDEGVYDYGTGRGDGDAIEVIMPDPITVTVLPAEKEQGPYTVSLPEGEGYTVVPIPYNADRVVAGGSSFTFGVVYDAGYTLNSVKANGVELAIRNGVYVLEDINEDIIVTVDITPPAPPVELDPDFTVTNAAYEDGVLTVDVSITGVNVTAEQAAAEAITAQFSVLIDGEPVNVEKQAVTVTKGNNILNGACSSALEINVDLNAMTPTDTATLRVAYLVTLDEGSHEISLAPGAKGWAYDWDSGKTVAGNAAVNPCTLTIKAPAPTGYSLTFDSTTVGGTGNYTPEVYINGERTALNALGDLPAGAGVQVAYRAIGRSANLEYNRVAMAYTLDGEEVIKVLATSGNQESFYFTMPAADVAFEIEVQMLYWIAQGSNANGSYTVARENGTIVLDDDLNHKNAYVRPGETVTVNAAPDEGYELVGLIVNGGAVEGNTFVMPAKDVSLGVVFKEAGAPDGPAFTVTSAAYENGVLTVDVSITGVEVSENHANSGSMSAIIKCLVEDNVLGNPVSSTINSGIKSATAKNHGYFVYLDQLAVNDTASITLTYDVALEPGTYTISLQPGDSVFKDGKTDMWVYNEDNGKHLQGDAVTAVPFELAVEPVAGGDEDQPEYSEFTITISDGIDGAASVQPGDAVNMTVTVSGGDYGYVNAAVTYDANLFEYLGSDDEGVQSENNGTIQIAKWSMERYDSSVALAALPFRALENVVGIGEFGFSYAVIKDTLADDSGDALVNDAIQATAVGDSVEIAIAAYSVTLSDGLAGPEIAVVGEDYTGAIEDYNDGYSYTVTYTVNGGEEKKAVVNGAAFTIPSTDVTGSIMVSVSKTVKGIEVTLYEDYVNGYTLLTVAGGGVYSYDGAEMYYVEDYEAYALVIEGKLSMEEALALLDIASESAGTIVKNCDVNSTGKVDDSDVYAAFYCVNGRLSFAKRMDWYLRADVNGDYVVDAQDVAQIFGSFGEV